MTANLLNLDGGQLHDLSQLLYSGSYPDAYRYLRDIADSSIRGEVNPGRVQELEVLRNWLDSAAKINADDGSSVSEFVRGATQAAGEIHGQHISDDQFQNASDYLADSVLRGVLKNMGVRSTGDIIRADVAVAVDGLNLPPWGWAGTLGDVLPIIFGGLGKDFQQVSGDGSADWLNNLGLAELANYAGFARAAGLGRDEISLLLKAGQALQKSQADMREALGNLYDAARDAVSPLVLDLDADGVETIAIENGVYFDHDGNGFAQQTGWVGRDDGLLVMDRNGNGLIDSGRELFGNQTVFSIDGSLENNGFSALGRLDSNRNGMIDGLDSSFSSLQVWIDVDGNGKTSAGELHGLAELGIESISLAYASGEMDAQGNMHSQIGSYNRADGSVGKIHDVWFKEDPGNTLDYGIYSPEIENSEIPYVAGIGSVSNLRKAVADDSSGTLRALISSFEAEKEAASREAIFEQILFKWTKSENIPVASRGIYVPDARKLHVLEMFMGDVFVQYSGTNAGTKNPGPNAAAKIQNAYDFLFSQLINQLTVKTHYANLLASISIELDANKVASYDLSSIVNSMRDKYAQTPESASLALKEFAQGLTSLGSWGKNILSELSALGQYETGNFSTILSESGYFGDDEIHGDAGNNSLFGWGGNDILHAGDGDDILNGGDGNDELYGDAGDDILDGGNGADNLAGGNGADKYLFGRGSGLDTIDNFDGDLPGQNVDRILLGAGISQTDITLTRSDEDLYIYINGTLDVLKVNRYFMMDGGSPNAVEEIVFSDGSVWRISQVKSMVLVPTEEADHLYGYSGDDVLNGLGGNDVVEGGNGDDTLSGGLGDDVLKGGNGADTYIYHLGDGDDVIDDVAITDYSIDRLVLGEGVNSSNIVIGRSGPDIVLNFSGGGSIRLVNEDHGFDAGVEQIVFTDGTLWTRQDLMLAYISQQQASGATTITGFNQSNDVLSGTFGDDTLYGADGNDMLTGGKGNDAMHGGAGEDVYFYHQADGHDVILESSSHDGKSDKLVFSNILASHVSLFRNGNDVKLIIAPSDVQGQEAGSILIKGQVNNLYGEGLEKIQFSDGTIWTPADIRSMLVSSAGTAENDNIQGTAVSDMIAGELGDDDLHGGAGADTYIYSSGDGHDVINEEASYDNTKDVVVLADISSSRASLQRSGNDVIVLIAESATGVGDGGSIVLKKQMNNYQGEGVERIQFSDGVIWTPSDIRLMLITAAQTTGNDNIVGTALADILRGGLGDDSLQGGGGEDTYIYQRGDGHDMISETASYDGTVDRVLLMDVASPQLSLSRNGNDVVLVIAPSLPGASDGGSITLKGNVNNSYGEGIERVEFSDGVIWTSAQMREMMLSAGQTSGDDNIVGTVHADVIAGGKGNDSMNGGAGADTYVYSHGDGNDVITEAASYDSTVDRLWLKDVMQSQVSLLRDGNDVKLVIAENAPGAADAGTVVLRGNINNANGEGVERVQFSDGTFWTAADIRGMLISSVGTSGNDSIIGSSASDILSGGPGDDSINGGAGADIYIYNRGDGNDIITDAASYDATVDKLFLNNISPSQVSFSRAGNDVIVIIAASNGISHDAGSITIKGGVNNSYGEGIEEIRFSDGTSWSAADIRVKLISSAATAGNDTIIGTSSSDIIFGGLGDDSLNGAGGADTYIYRAGDGHDIIVDAPSYDVTVDSLVLSDISSSQISLERRGNDVILNIAESDIGANNSGSVVLKGGVNNTYGEGVERIQFKDGSVWNSSDIRLLLISNAQTPGDDSILGTADSDSITGGAGNDSIDGAGGADTYIYHRGDGHDIIADAPSYDSTVDKLILFDIAASQVSLVRSGNDVKLVISESAAGAGDSGSLLLKGSVNNAYGEGLERVQFADGTVWNSSDIRIILVENSQSSGDDSILGTASSDTLKGGLGNDVLNGMGGPDIYIYHRGDGHDTISDAPSYDATVDKLLLDDILASQVSLLRNENDVKLIISESNPGAGDAGSIILKNNLMNSYGEGIEKIEFLDGTTWSPADIRAMLMAAAGTPGEDDIIGTAGSDVIAAGLGNDSINGGAGSDTYIYNLGDGHDSITEPVAYDNSVDKLILGDSISTSDTLISRSGLDVTLTFSDGGTLKLVGQGGANGSGIEQVVFGDGTVWSRQDLLSATPLSSAALAQAEPSAGLLKLVGTPTDQVLQTVLAMP